MQNSSNVTLLLERARSGDATAESDLIDVLYDELKAIARRALARGGRHDSLQPTALVNDVYMRLVRQDDRWVDSNHFKAVAATAMRRFLADRAKHRRAARRGGGQYAVTLGDNPAKDGSGIDAIELDETLSRLKKLAPDQARIVELRCLGGLDVSECAEHMKISERSVKRKWQAARLWLRRELKTEGALGDEA